MPRAILLYYSIGGTTRRVAETIASGLAEEGVETTLHDLREGAPADIASYDLLGVGTPAHYFRAPSPVTDALDEVGSLSGRGAFAFVLHGTYRGKALNVLRGKLRGLGTAELGSLALYGEGHFLPYQRLGFLSNPGRPNEQDLARATAFGRTLATRLVAFRDAGAVPEPEPMDPPTHWVYALERAVTLPPLGTALYSHFFRADRTTCTKCGKCARVCPTHNIEFARGEFPAWGRDCITCLNCISLCPEDAVRSPIDWWVFEPFYRYNVRRARRQHSFPYVRAVHRRGKTEIVEEEARDEARAQ
jgi:flavodoxin/ferredoxin